MKPPSQSQIAFLRDLGHPNPESISCSVEAGEAIEQLNAKRAARRHLKVAEKPSVVRLDESDPNHRRWSEMWSMHEYELHRGKSVEWARKVSIEHFDPKVENPNCWPEGIRAHFTDSDLLELRTELRDEYPELRTELPSCWLRVVA